MNADEESQSRKWKQFGLFFTAGKPRKGSTQNSGSLQDDCRIEFLEQPNTGGSRYQELDTQLQSYLGYRNVLHHTGLTLREFNIVSFYCTPKRLTKRWRNYLGHAMQTIQFRHLYSSRPSWGYSEQFKIIPHQEESILSKICRSHILKYGFCTYIVHILEEGYIKSI